MGGVDFLLSVFLYLKNVERTHAGGKCFYLMKIHVQFLETSFSIERVLIIYNGGLDIFTWGLSS